MNDEKKAAQESKTVVINYTPPTTKQQLTSAAIQVGAALALPVVFVGVGVIASKVSDLREKRAARRDFYATAIDDALNESTDSK